MKNMKNMKKVMMMACALVMSVVGMKAQEVVTLVRPTTYAPDAYNLLWQAVSEDGTTRWQVDFYKMKTIEDGTYGKETLLGGYTYAFDCHDSIARMDITDIEMTFSHDGDGLEHVVANVQCGSKAYTLRYDEPKVLPEATDTVKIEVTDAEFSDMRRMYGNLRMSGTAGKYTVGVTLSGDYKNAIEGDYDWSQVCAIGTEIEQPAQNKHIPARDMKVSIREQVYTDTTGYVLEGEMLGADNILYKVTLYYHPHRPFVKKVLIVTDYTMDRKGDDLLLTLIVSKDTTFTLLLHTMQMAELQTYSMANGEVESEYLNADVRAYINKEHDSGETYAIEANIYTEDYIHYILVYDGENKDDESGMDEVRGKSEEVRKEIREGRVVIMSGGSVYEVTGARE